MKVVHVETRIVTLLGVLDDEGNVARTLVLQADPNDPNDPLVIRKPSPAAFEAAAHVVRRTRARVEAELASPTSPKATEIASQLSPPPSADVADAVPAEAT